MDARRDQELEVIHPPAERLRDVVIIAGEGDVRKEVYRAVDARFRVQLKYVLDIRLSGIGEQTRQEAGKILVRYDERRREKRRLERVVPRHDVETIAAEVAVTEGDGRVYRDVSAVGRWAVAEGGPGR